ncbi:glycoside hydrolase family 5 protein [Leptospira idonii]|uniref:Glycosyl hydrolase family 5 n=1 Tax=Leptospira idonii TaxID=1193500 RepID=A0A4R9M5D8_9LEPT|nr:cellulase family glycosylhydrolase [Leptospira idonii]TGN19958.1 glycosyl hydrolase family 5 [Leptospira idonii]
MKKIRPSGEWFVDESGRKLILRGVNLGGDTKCPYPNGGTHHPTDFSDHKEVSFIGRPFPLEEAKEHFTRLKQWGFNCLRLLTTWEAVEHKGPKEYDLAYLDYFTEITKQAGDYGFYVFVDFHQDVWSRMTGGDGAPGWIFEKVGIDYTKLSDANAALVMQKSYDYSKPGTRQEKNYPTMSWSQNYKYAGNGILWTLFFGGKDFAPSFLIDGKNVQDYLQEHYFGAMLQVAERVKDFPHVLGFDSLNEPGKGFIGRAMNDRGILNTEEDPARPGLAWSPIDALYSSQGFTIELPYLELNVLKGGFVPARTETVNQSQTSIWLPHMQEDPFQSEGAWSLTKDGTPFIEKNDFFQNVKGKVIDFDRDYMIPFIRRMADAVHSVRSDWMIFAEREATDGWMNPNFNAALPKNSVNAAHWYDIMTLIFKRFLYPIAIDPLRKLPVFGENGIRKMYVNQLKRVKDASAEVPGKIPSLIGEFGIPFDLKAGKSYKQWFNGNHKPSIWKHHIRALNCMYNAMDDLLLSNTIWNYTVTNRNDLMIGDGWNQEDLSIYSPDQKLPHSEPDLYGGGGRAIEGFCRPYAQFTQGTPLEMKYSLSSGKFYFKWKPDPSSKEPTVIVTPRFVYPKGIKIETKNCKQVDAQEHHVCFISEGEEEAEITIQPL